MRKKKANVEYKSTLGDPPAMVQGHALEIWHELAPELLAAGLGARVERYPLAQLCMALAEIATAQRHIDENGLTITTERGCVKNPAIAIKTQAMTAAHRISASFGMLPGSRGRVKFASSQSEKDARDSQAILESNPEGYYRYLKENGVAPTNEFAAFY